MSVARLLGCVVLLLSLTSLAIAQGKLVNKTGPKEESKSDSNPYSSSRMGLPPPPEEVGGRNLDAWMRDLNSADASVRATAISNLTSFRENAAPAIPALLGRLHDGDTSPRVKAVIAFRYLPEIRENDISRVVSALAEKLDNDTQAIVRYEAAVSLNRFAGKNHAAIDALVRGTRSGLTWEIRNASLITLRSAGWDPEKGPDPRATRAMLMATTDSTREVRMQAIISLGAMGRPPDPHLLTEVVEKLVTWTRASHKPTALWAHVSLILLGDKLKDKSLDAIAKDLTAKERETRIQGINALGVLGEKARSKVPDVLDTLSDSEDTVITAALQALPRMKDTGPRVIKPIIDLTRLKKDHASVILSACLALQQMGKTDPDIVKAMEDVTQRSDLQKELRYAVDAALKELLKPKEEDPEQPKPREVPIKPKRGNVDRPVDNP